MILGALPSVIAFGVGWGIGFTYSGGIQRQKTRALLTLAR